MRDRFDNMPFPVATFHRLRSTYQQFGFDEWFAARMAEKDCREFFPKGFENREVDLDHDGG